MAAGYRRETLMLRAPGGARMGFVVWERGARQGSLRCHIEGLPAEQRFRLLWMAEGAFALSDGGEIRSDAGGAARQTLLLAGDVPLIGVVLAREDGALCAQAFIGARKTGEPERLQALLNAQWAPPAPRGTIQTVPEEPDAGPVQETTPEPEKKAGLEKKAEQEAMPVQVVNPAEKPDADAPVDLRRIEAAGQGYAPAWPPPPGLPGAVWQAGRWRAR